MKTQRLITIVAVVAIVLSLSVVGISAAGTSIAKPTSQVVKKVNIAKLPTVNFNIPKLPTVNKVNSNVNTQSQTTVNKVNSNANTQSQVKVNRNVNTQSQTTVNKVNSNANTQSQVKVNSNVNTQSQVSNVNPTRVQDPSQVQVVHNVVTPVVNLYHTPTPPPFPTPTPQEPIFTWLSQVFTWLGSLFHWIFGFL
jgi:hypothetical protein